MIFGSNLFLNVLFYIVFPAVIIAAIIAIFISGIKHKQEGVEIPDFDEYLRGFFLSHGQEYRIDEVIEQAKKDPFGGLYAPFVYNGAKKFIRWGLSANKVTILNFVLSLAIFYLTLVAGEGHLLQRYTVQPLYGILLFPAGLLVLITGTIDGMDGAVATLLGKKSKSGGWFDAIIDRVSDVIMLVCLIPGGYLVIQDWGNADFSWLVWVNVCLIFIYEYMRAKHYEVGLTKTKPTMGERVSRILMQSSFFMVYGVNSLVGLIIALVDPAAAATDPYPLYVGETNLLMFIFMVSLAVIMAVAISVFASWTWKELKKLDLGEAPGDAAGEPAEAEKAVE